MRRYPLTETLNTRDLGGYPVSPRRETKYRRLIRSDLPRSLTAEELSFFREINLSTVIDLRSEGETVQSPCYFRQVDGVDYLKLHLNVEIDLNGTGFADTYWQVVREGTGVCHIMRAIADATGAVLFHCAAGKDRTGITAALLLGLAGVSRADILADYQVSATYIRPVIDELRELHPDLPYYMGESDPAFMDFCLTRLEETFGGIPEYFAAIGLTEDEVARLRGKLLD